MADILLLPVHGVIGEDFLLEDAETLFENNPDATHIRLDINTPGGDIRTGAEVYRKLMEYRAKGATVEVVISGICASMGTGIAMAASPGMLKASSPWDMWMVHKPLVPELEYANADDLRWIADQLDEYEKPLAYTYSERTGKHLEEIQELMRKELVMSAHTALEWGFIDSIINPEATSDKAQAELKAVAFYTPKPNTTDHNSMTEQQEQSLVEKVVSAVATAFGLKPKAEAPEEAPAEQAPSVVAASVNSDQGTLYFEGESLEVGTKVFTDEALTEAAPDGAYKLDSGETANVTEGQVTELVPAEEEAPAEAPAEATAQAEPAIVAQLRKENAELKAQLAAKPSVPGSGNPVAQAPQNFTGTVTPEEPFAASAQNIRNKYSNRRK